MKRKLEAKARIYDRVQQGEDMDDYMKENCLVDFDGKEIPERKKESERGRSRHTSYAVSQIKIYLFKLFLMF